MRQRHNSDKEPPVPGLFSTLFLLLLLGLFAGEVFTNYQPAKLSALFFALFWIPLLAFHEAGHAIAAASLGWRVHRVVVGTGRLVWSFRVGTVPIEVRMFPVEGFALLAPVDMHSPRLKAALTYFAGPGSSLLVVLITALAVGPSTLLTPTDHVGIIVLQSLCLSALTSAILNLIPAWSASLTGEAVANDGLGIIRSFTRPLSDFADMVDPAPAEEWEQDADWWKR